MNRWNPLSWFHRPPATPPEKRDVGKVAVTVHLEDGRQYDVCVKGRWLLVFGTPIVNPANVRAHELIRRWQRNGVACVHFGYPGDIVVPTLRVKEYTISPPQEHLVEAEVIR